MATILLNGVVTDASTISGSDLNDKLTVSGGEDGLSVDLAAGDDAVEIFANSEDITDTEIRVSEGDDTIEVLAAEEADADFVGMPISLGDSLLGGPGDDVIMLEDGLVQLTGAVKGNEGDDTIHVANINGGTVNGNAGDDTISLGLFADEMAGSRAANAITNGSVMGGQGDDTITVDADITDSAIRGNEGDDTITLEGGDVSGASTINGNAGNDTIDASDVEGGLTIIGGKGDDTLIAGNGQTVRGNLGSDTFVVGASGGVFIEDFDKLDLDGDESVDLEDCFCDDEIQVQNITFETHTYDVERVKYTSASSWTGDIKVKAVADAGGDNDTATVTLAATKTETLTAKAVARLFITETNIGFTGALPAVKYDATDLGVRNGFGITKSGETFANGLADGPESTNVLGAVVGSGIGAAYGQATGFWTNTKTSLSAFRTASGAIRNVVVATTTQFEKGDFSFLQLTATEKVGVTTNQKLVYSDITNATVKNHWASYNKVKETNTANLYTMNFGTANFDTVTTGKAYMVITALEDKVFKTTTLDVTGANATAKVTLDLDNTFEAWIKNLAGTGTTASGSFTQITNLGATGRTPNQLLWSTVTARGLATLTTTARNTPRANINGSTNTNISLVAGINNTARTKDDFVTNTGRLVMKIAVSETATAKATKALATLVERTTIFGEELTITTCPDFPTVSELATRIVDGQAKHGDVTGDFNTRYLWADENNSITGIAATGVNPLIQQVASRLSNTNAGQGFFSASAFTVNALEVRGFGDVATAAAGNTDAQNVPFRVLFFDNDATSNGLYIMSGTANYKGGELTALNTNPTTSSAMGGKHTIVKVSGGKGSVIELSDINLV